MRVVAVRVERGAVFVEFIRVDFAVMVGEREHFVAGEFDSARLMHVHMSGGGRHHARIRWGDGVDDDLVGLSAADEEEDFGAGVVVFERQHGRSFCCGLLAIGKVWFRAFGRRG